MTLTLEIEFLSGVSVATRSPASSTPDWPPQPDRVFSALVHAWGSRGEDATEREALEWLERQPPPRISASEVEPRTVVDVFVPPNDPRSDRSKHAREVLPRHRSRQPRRFVACLPLDPVVRLHWMEAEASPAHLAALNRLAATTASVGHSSSLVRCRFLQAGEEAGPPGDLRWPRRPLYRGRLRELREAYLGGARPEPGYWLPPVPPEMARPGAPAPFGEGWLLLRHTGGRMADLRAAALVCREIRRTLMSGFARAGLGDRIPEELSGHSADGAPSLRPHAALAPLPFAGFPHADGHIMGFALIPPRGSALLEDRGLMRALRTLTRLDAARAERRLTVHLPAMGHFPPAFIQLALTLGRAPGPRTLDPALYLGPATLWATVTPVVLDRHLRGRSESARARRLPAELVRTCVRSGYPEPLEVFPDASPALEGVPPLARGGRAPGWTRWQVPRWLGSRSLTHAVLRFPSPVRGPLLIGAGRFSGLGLCRPLQ